MLREEFEKRTGFYPTAVQYAEIEKVYMAFRGDKDAFCRAYKKNRDGMAESIQRQVDMAMFSEKQAHEKALASRDAEIERLKKALEREQEWADHEDSRNVSQADYFALAQSCGTEKLSADRAKDLLAREFGFDARKISIVCSVPIWQINRHRELRFVGSADRPPVYNSSDWYYIRFDCASMSWEAYNGELRPFVH